jgi:chromatin segregation and condensation protein Rec8/ScpA/Scc1 (kleisin family)
MRRKQTQKEEKVRRLLRRLDEQNMTKRANPALEQKPERLRTITCEGMSVATAVKRGT